MKICKGDFKVVRVISEEELLAEGLNYEDAVAIVQTRAKNQLSQRYIFEVRNLKNVVQYAKQAHGEE